MRLLALALAGLAVLSFVSLTAEPAQAVGICADEGGYNGNPDLYNNMGDPSSDCDGIVCMGYTGGAWQTCVPPTIHCTTSATSCGPPIELAAATSSSSLALCTAGDLYNNQAGQASSGCDGAACTGWNQSGWQTCYPEIGPCTCPPPQEPLGVTLDLAA